MGNAPFVVVYFNADAELGVLPSNSFFLDVHSALRPAHRRQLRVSIIRRFAAVACAMPCAFAPHGSSRPGGSLTAPAVLHASHTAVQTGGELLTNTQHSVGSSLALLPCMGRRGLAIAA